MPTLLYISHARFPTEKAHGLQIIQNCEAFASAGYDVQLWVGNRRNTAEMNAIGDVYAHYGVERTFMMSRVPSIDLYPLVGENLRLQYIAFYVHLLTFNLILLLRLLFTKVDVLYSRDMLTLLILSLFFPAEKLAYEAHQFAGSGRGNWLQKQVVTRVGHVVTITPQLKEKFVTQYEAEASNIHIAHDGIRAKRFENVPDKATARERIGWAKDAFIVGYLGRLHTMGMDKGVGLLMGAVAETDVTLALVGGPEDMAHHLQQKWIDNGNDPARFVYAGSVSPDAVPLYLSAFDVCAMPLPWTEHFAYFTSALKLFEYMASGRAILTTNLPSILDVVTHQETAFIVEHSDEDALKDGITTLYENQELRETIAQKAQETVFAEYTWQARAERIRAHIERAGLVH
ncbi:MAG: glycosyltransferase family 4 protein [Chloroflexota bacterium]